MKLKLALVEPTYLSTEIPNNKWMEEIPPEQRKVNKELAYKQWFNLYSILTQGATVYLVPPKKEFQDQVYIVNAGVVLPHLQLYQNRNVCVLSKFKAQGRPGEELELKKLVEELGYEVYQCPYYFEGEAELKWLCENVYVAGYGVRTSKRAHTWLMEQFDCKIIPVETDEWLYHLDCLLFPISNDYCILCEDIPQDIKNEIKKYTNVIEVDYDFCLEGITNSFRINSLVLNADVSKIAKDSPQALKQIKSEQEILTEICSTLGLTPVFIDLSEYTKSGALLSCMILHLTWEECYLG
jgi:N-dimethylarginine dimethylaminohydrolase